MTTPAEYIDTQNAALSFESESLEYTTSIHAFQNLVLENTTRFARILDVACGDGAGLAHLKSKNYIHLYGVEANPEKAARALAHGFPIAQRDMHDLNCFSQCSFDLVLSSHTLEHAYDPALFLRQIHRILTPTGQFSFVIPWPDDGPPSIHCAKTYLGSDKADLDRLELVLREAGFLITFKCPTTTRGPELAVSCTPR